MSAHLLLSPPPEAIQGTFVDLPAGARVAPNGFISVICCLFLFILQVLNRTEMQTHC